MRHSLLLAGLASLLTVGASAHEYIAKPAATQAAPGASIPVEVVSSHVFIRSQELEDPKDSTAAVWFEGKRTPVALTADEKAELFRGNAISPGESCFLLTGHRAGQVWSTTPQGTKRVGREAQGATNTRLIEKFSKAVVNASTGDLSCLRPIGDKLEIISRTNPADIKPGQEIEVQVLLDGQPVTVPVFATFDGFSAEENTYAYYTEGRPDGTARVKVTQPGLWMVRAEYTGAEKTSAYDRYVGRATLIFQVK